MLNTYQPGCVIHNMRWSWFFLCVFNQLSFLASNFSSFFASLCFLGCTVWQDLQVLVATAITALQLMQLVFVEPRGIMNWKLKKQFDFYQWQGTKKHHHKWSACVISGLKWSQAKAQWTGLETFGICLSLQQKERHIMSNKIVDMLNLSWMLTQGHCRN